METTPIKCDWCDRDAVKESTSFLGDNYIGCAQHHTHHTRGMGIAETVLVNQ